VEGGGNLLMSFFSGISDPNDHIRLGGYPQPFVRVLGLHVIDWVPLGDAESVAVHFADAGKGSNGASGSDAGGAIGDMWAELIELQGAEVLATFAASHLNGHPAVTLNRFGAGSAEYVGTQLDSAALAELVIAACRRVGVRPVMQLAEGIEAVRRDVPGGSILFLMNHTDASVEITVPGDAVALNGGKALTAGRLHLGPRDVAILRRSEVGARA